MLRALLMATAILETATGAGLLLAPTLVVSLLLGAPLDERAALIVARAFGAALAALGVVSGMARDDPRSPASRGLVVGLLLYNAVVLALLGFAGIGPGMRGVALWPAVAAHAALAAWCAVCLLAGSGDAALLADHADAAGRSARP